MKVYIYMFVCLTTFKEHKEIFYYNTAIGPEAVAHAFNQTHPSLHSKFQANQGLYWDPISKQQKINF